MDYTYIYKRNFIHDTNSLVKFFMFLSYIPLISVFNHPLYLLILFGNVVLIAYIGNKVQATPMVDAGFGKIMRSAKFTLYLGIFLLLINILLRNDGDTVLLRIPLNVPLFGSPVISVETIVYSLMLVFQLILILLTFSLINYLINPDKLLKSTVKLRIPYLLMFLTIFSVRFFSLIMGDADTITDVQRSRGLELDKGNALTRLKNRMRLILPLLTNSLERSIQVSEALDARAFGIGQKRSYLNEEKYTGRDFMVIMLNIGLMGTLLYLNALQGFGNYSIYPHIAWPSLTVWDVLALGSILIVNIISILLLKIQTQETQKL